MAKSIVRFSFPGNVVWYPDIKNRWAKILVDYIESELEIGNGTFLDIVPCFSKDVAELKDTYPSDHIVTEIICDIPHTMIRDEYAIRARLITLLEDRNFDFIKFHNCGPTGDTSMLIDRLEPQISKP